MITKRSALYATVLALSALAGAGAIPCRAGDFDLASTRDTKSGALDEGRFGRERLTFSFDSRLGYDDNTLDTPDDVITLVADPLTGKVRRVSTKQNLSDSVFVNFDLGASYTAASPRAVLGISADVGLNYYFDRPGRSYDVNGGTAINLTYKLTPKAVLQVNSYDIYESEPNYGASNLTGFTGVGGAGANPGTSSQRNGDYFYTSDHLALTYQFAPRFSTVSAFDIVAFAYAQEPFSTLEDRVELYADEQFRYLIRPTLSAVAEYRFGYVDYFGINSDSINNFVLAGVDYSFNPRLHGEVRGGAQFRQYIDAPESDISPYFEGTLTYDISRISHLTAISRYSIEEGDLTSGVSNSRLFRLGATFDQTFASRLRGYVSVYYTHGDYHSLVNLAAIGYLVNSNTFGEDTYDVATGLSFAFNRRVSAEVGYTYTDVVSQDQNRSYSRNRCFAGIRLSF